MENNHTMDEETKKELRANAGVFFIAHLSDFQIASLAAAFSMFHREFTRGFNEVVEKEKEQWRREALGELAQLTMMEAREWAKNMEKERWEDNKND